LIYAHPSGRKLRVCAVSYLNTVPLVWGMLHGEQRGLFEIEFAIPSECADRIEAGSADLGILPSAEFFRLGLTAIPGTGIACRGPVRSILLVSKVPRAEIRVLAADTSSRTSVQLARILLERNHGARPAFVPCRPELPAMLEAADAALIIGDPALRVDVERSSYPVYDLGEEWTATTGLPMVFAVWAGRPECVTPDLARPFLESCRYGLTHLEDIVRAESAPRGMSPSLVRTYFERNVTLEFGDQEYAGLELFRRLLLESGPVPLGE
jgi:predicted solute-binding protein